MQVITVKTLLEGSLKALQLLYLHVDQKTLLLLSGGKTPEMLYTLIAKEQKLAPGAVGLTDERYGNPMHQDSNEKMITETRFSEYCNEKSIPLYEMLDFKEMEKIANDYNRVLEFLLKEYAKRVSIMGIGEDGHIAGIPLSLEYDHSQLVVAHTSDIKGFSKRITVTFEALEQVQTHIILAFGENKRPALQKMMKETNEKEFPAAFFSKQPGDIYLITDCLL